MVVEVIHLVYVLDPVFRSNVNMLARQSSEATRKLFESDASEEDKGGFIRHVLVNDEMFSHKFMEYLNAHAFKVESWDTTYTGHKLWTKDHLFLE